MYYKMALSSNKLIGNIHTIKINNDVFSILHYNNKNYVKYKEFVNLVNTVADNEWDDDYALYILSKINDNYKKI
jgi:hypothetical protein